MILVRLKRLAEKRALAGRAGAPPLPPRLADNYEWTEVPSTNRPGDEVYLKQAARLIKHGLRVQTSLRRLRCLGNTNNWEFLENILILLSSAGVSESVRRRQVRVRF